MIYNFENSQKNPPWVPRTEPVPLNEKNEQLQNLLRKGESKHDLGNQLTKNNPCENNHKNRNARNKIFTPKIMLAQNSKTTHDTKRNTRLIAFLFIAELELKELDRTNFINANDDNYDFYLILRNFPLNRQTNQSKQINTLDHMPFFFKQHPSLNKIRTDNLIAF